MLVFDDKELLDRLKKEKEDYLVFLKGLEDSLSDDEIFNSNKNIRKESIK